MAINFQNIDQSCVTFSSFDALEDQLVKVSSRGTVSVCNDGDDFCGLAIHHRGNFCSVQLEGFVTVPYTGSTPAMGWTQLVANGTGGAKASSSGRTYLVVDADLINKMLTFKL